MKLKANTYKVWQRRISGYVRRQHWCSKTVVSHRWTTPLTSNISSELWIWRQFRKMSSKVSRKAQTNSSFGPKWDIKFTVKPIVYMQLLCLAFLLMDLPKRKRRFTRASSNTSNASPVAAACLSNSYILKLGRRCNSSRIPAAAAAVQVLSHAGWGLLNQFQL